MTTPTIMKTWAALAADLDLPEGPATELARALTAPLRHAARVEAATEAARAWAREHMVHGDNVDTLAAAICAADAVGIGGQKGLEGRSTTRHPAFAWPACGKSRKQATDGGAWTAAIFAAGWDLAGREETPTFGVFDGSLAGDESVPEGALPLTFCGVLVPPGIIPLPWIVAIAGNGLWRALAVAGVAPLSREDIHGFFSGDSSVDAWALLFNEANKHAEDGDAVGAEGVGAEDGDAVGAEGVGVEDVGASVSGVGVIKGMGDL